jgi:lipopolysaccharide transport system ATP-binding protein
LARARRRRDARRPQPRAGGAGSPGPPLDDGEGPAPAEYLWALDHVSFEIAEGAVVGIIGRQRFRQEHAAQDPLEDHRADVRPRGGPRPRRARSSKWARVSSELSGRENVYVNGAILGMRRREITRKFDEIVAFADVARFIDTPVKHYSSGMQMRLAFAVAAHLEPTILLVDEVLAVGDAEFQRRCLGKMQDVSREGRTVLLVSHQLGRFAGCARP